LFLKQSYFEFSNLTSNIDQVRWRPPSWLHTEFTRESAGEEILKIDLQYEKL